MNKLQIFILSTVIILISCTKIFPQTDIGFKGIGGQLGIVNPDGPGGSTLMFAAIADLGKFTPLISFDAHLAYWKKSEPSFSLRDLILGGTAKYYFPFSDPKFSPFAGAGLAIHIFKRSFEILAPTSSSTDTELDLHITGGTLYKLAPNIDGIGQISYTLGDAEQFAILFGAIFKFIP